MKAMSMSSYSFVAGVSRIQVMDIDGANVSLTGKIRDGREEKKKFRVGGFHYIRDFSFDVD